MQLLLLLFFALIALALIAILGAELFGDSSQLLALFELFKTPDIAISLTVAILIAAFLTGLIFAWQSWLRRSPINALIDWLDSRAPGQLEMASNLDDFARQIPAVHAPLGHAWEEFAETLIRPDPNRPEDGESVRNTVRPSAYFNVQATVEAGFHLPFLQALPNYFVGFGLLCTFLGLVSGLHFAAAGVASADASVARESLKDLLNAATFKFLAPPHIVWSRDYPDSSVKSAVSYTHLTLPTIYSV